MANKKTNSLPAKYNVSKNNNKKYRKKLNNNKNNKKNRNSNNNKTQKSNANKKSKNNILNNHNHNHPAKQKLTFGQKAADALTSFAGSWTFIIALFVIIALWISANVLFYIYHWDPYPFILLNFVLSCLAAVQAPIILMSQNRQAERDRIRAEYDYRVNRKAEREVSDMQNDLEIIKKLIKDLKKKK